MDFGGRGAAGSGETAAFGSELGERGSDAGLPGDSPLLRCWSAMGSAGYRPELLKRSISLISDLAYSCAGADALPSAFTAGQASSAGPICCVIGSLGAALAAGSA
jgi:hypothetical protein